MAMVKLKATPGHVVEVSESQAPFYRPCLACKTSGKEIYDTGRLWNGFWIEYGKCPKCAGFGFIKQGEPEYRMEVA